MIAGAPRGDGVEVDGTTSVVDGAAFDGAPVGESGP
jgi:hypothetical protein